MDIHDEWNGAAGDAFGVGTEYECDAAAGNPFGNELFPKPTATPPQHAPSKKSNMRFTLRQSQSTPPPTTPDGHEKTNIQK